MIGLRHELLEVTERLVKEYEAILPAGSVPRCVVRCRDELLLLGLSDGLLETVDAMEVVTKVPPNGGPLTLATGPFQRQR